MHDVGNLRKILRKTDAYKAMLAAKRFQFPQSSDEEIILAAELDVLNNCLARCVIEIAGDYAHRTGQCFPCILDATEEAAMVNFKLMLEMGKDFYNLKNIPCESVPKPHTNEPGTQTLEEILKSLKGA